jgi:4-hydroxy-3-methylbut-2-en-1-yl diphosphate synthase IspG/GcpE
MNEQIKNIVNLHCELIQSELKTESIAKAVKSIDTIVQRMYLELYGLKDITYNTPICIKNVEKKSHCC